MRLFYEACDKATTILRSTLWLAALVQAGTVVVGLVMAWHAIDCALMHHHGNSLLCTIGVMVNILSFQLVAAARERVDDALSTNPG